MSKRNRNSKAIAPRRAGVVGPQANENPAAGATVSLVRQELYAGPLPPPNMLAEYDRIQPGFANRIFQLTEEQAHHRMSLERAVVLGDMKRSWVGLWCGLTVSLAAMVIAGILAWTGQGLAAGFVATMDIGSIVGTFVYATLKRKQERLEKASTRTR